MATMKSVQENSTKDKALTGEIELTLNERLSSASLVSMTMIPGVNMLSRPIFCVALKRRAEKVPHSASSASLSVDKGFFGNYTKTTLLY